MRKRRMPSPDAVNRDPATRFLQTHERFLKALACIQGGRLGEFEGQKLWRERMPCQAIGDEIRPAFGPKMLGRHIDTKRERGFSPPVPIRHDFNGAIRHIAVEINDQPAFLGQADQILCRNIAATMGPSNQRLEPENRPIRNVDTWLKKDLQLPKPQRPGQFFDHG